MSSKRYEVSCVGCGTTFTAKNTRAKWCSDYCRKQTKYGVPCSTCGEKLYDGYAKAGDTRTCAACHESQLAERRERIIEAWEQGIPTKEIAAQIGTTATAVLSLLDNHRRIYGEAISLRRRRSRELWDEILRRRAAGESNGEIGTALGTTATNISVMCQAMRKAGIEVPPAAHHGGFMPVERRESIIETWNAGASIDEVVERFGYANRASAYRGLTHLRQTGAALKPRRKVAA